MRALEVPAERGVVLQAVTRPVLVDRQAAEVFGRNGRTNGCCEFDARREALPGIFGLQPPAFALDEGARERDQQNPRQTAPKKEQKAQKLTPRGLSAES
jgi:regulator of protease activity HflC (stomatin/prohibitin superfamily)